MAEKKWQEKRAVERRLHETEVTFQRADAICLAKSVDISDYGIRVITDKPLTIRILINEEDRQVQCDAQLVWARMKEDGTMEYGLKY